MNKGNYSIINKTIYRSYKMRNSRGWIRTYPAYKVPSKKSYRIRKYWRLKLAEKDYSIGPYEDTFKLDVLEKELNIK